MDRIREANFTPLTHAVAIGDDATVLFLLETGADPELQDSDGRSALTLAVQNGHLKSVAYLLEYGANPEAVDGSGKSPIELAKHNSLESALNLLTGAASEIHDGHREHGKHVRRKQKPIKIKSRWSIVRTVVLWLVGAGVAAGAFAMRSSFNSGASQTIFDSISTNSIGQISRLLINGISPNIRDEYGNSALLMAANSGRLDIVRLLLKNHADPNLGTPEGISALRHSGIEHEEIVSLLLDSGANPNKADARGRTLLAYACSSGRYSTVVGLLLKHKANPNVIGENGPPLVSLIEAGDDGQIGSMEALIASGADTNAKDSASTPILVWSAEQGSVEIVKLLLESHAKVSTTDALKRTALDVACRQERTEIVQLLLEHGADPNTKDKEGNTSVMYALSGIVDAPDAAVSACESIIRLLSQHGARLDVPNGSGTTPSQYAADMGLNRIQRSL